MRLNNRVAGFLALASSILAGSALADGLTPVPKANPKVPGQPAPNVLSPDLIEVIAAQGSQPVENPGLIDLGGGRTFAVPFYGYLGDGSLTPVPGATQAPGANVEAKKTEPDKNTYLVLRGLQGADPSYDYGRRFLFQGHEAGPVDDTTRVDSYLTRINLDADGAHRVTLLATADKGGNPIPAIDGSTWDPFAGRLLFTAEQGALGGVWQATPDYPSFVEDLSGVFGHGAYEGVQNDSFGNVWLVEDSGGVKGTTNKNARQPNSFVYRFLPKNAVDLTAGGRLQALQVLSLSSPGQPIAFHAGQADADILSQDVKDLHTYGKVFTTRWITLHDTDVDGFTPFDANALAKTKLATPFKRPENGQFRPGSGFSEFFFDETGDTDIRTEAGSAYGGFGSVMRLWQFWPGADTGRLSLFYLGDATHTGLDNVAFWSDHQVVFVEDAGDTLHTQRNAFDSAWLFDTRVNYGVSGRQPTRILALGRDASATVDSGLLGISGNGFQNDGDNEITGLHVSDGDPSPWGILGARVPRPFDRGWRVFYTQQHGDNVTWEILAAPGRRHDDDH